MRLTSVLKADFELRFAVSALQSRVLEELLRALAEDYPVQRLLSDTAGYELSSSDGEWISLISTHHAAVTSRSATLVEDFSERIRRLVDSMQTALEGETIHSVWLRYSNVLPVRHHHEELLNEALRQGPWQHEGEFAQTLTGSFHGCEYLLRYGVHSFDEESFYLAESSMLARDVDIEMVERVLVDLAEEGQRLLTWPLAQEVEVEEGLRLEALDPWVEGELRGIFDRFAETHMDLLSRLTTPSFPEEINRARSELLMRKYGGAAWSGSDEAQLQELSDRVRDLWPRVTASDWQALSEIDHRIEERAQRLREAERRLGLKLAS